MRDKIDAVDQAMINELQENPEIEMKELKEKVNERLSGSLSLSTIYHRKNKLLENGLISKAFVPNYQKLGEGTIAFIAVKFEGHSEETLEKFTQFKKVMEVHAVAGGHDCLLKTRCKDVQEIADLVFQLRTEFDIIKDTEIFMVLRTKKESPNLEI